MKHEKELNEKSISQLTKSELATYHRESTRLFGRIKAIEEYSKKIREVSGKRQKVEIEGEYPFHVLWKVYKMIGDANARCLIGSLQVHTTNVHIRVKRIPRHWKP